MVNDAAGLGCHLFCEQDSDLESLAASSVLLASISDPCKFQWMGLGGEQLLRDQSIALMACWQCPICQQRTTCTARVFGVLGCHGKGSSREASMNISEVFEQSVLEFGPSGGA